MSYVIGSWREGMQGVSAAIDKTFGETLTLIPCVLEPNMPSRGLNDEAVTLRGQFLYRQKLAFAHHAGGDGPLIQSQEPIATFSHAALPYEINRGDRIRRETDQTLWEVTRVSSDGVSRVTCHLVELGVAEL